MHLAPDPWASRLEERRSNGLERTILPRAGIDFCSNDLLGFAEDPELKRRIRQRLPDVGNGSSGSRLVRGQTPEIARAEARLAEFSGTESALIFPSGYQANLALLQALLSPEDVVFSDALNHASLIDGIRLSGARKRIYPHLDLTALENALTAEPRSPGTRLIVTESLFGMEGDLAPLAEICTLAQAHDAHVVVDETHATGIFGSGVVRSEGLGSQVLATIHSGGKALGCAGAWIAGEAWISKICANFGRAFQFSTAPSPILSLSLEESVAHWHERGPARANSVMERSQQLRERLGLRPGRSPIVPIRVGSAQTAMEISARLQSRGYDVRAIRPPTVPEGEARLRVTLPWPRTAAEIRGLSRELEDVLK